MKLPITAFEKIYKIDENNYDNYHGCGAALCTTDEEKAEVIILKYIKDFGIEEFDENLETLDFPILKNLVLKNKAAMDFVQKNNCDVYFGMVSCYTFSSLAV